MRIATVEYFDVSYDPNADWAGSHIASSIAKFSNEEAANTFAENHNKENGGWGGLAKVKQVTQSFIIYDTADEADSKTRARLAEQALAKLTIEEREALNLK